MCTVSSLLLKSRLPRLFNTIMKSKKKCNKQTMIYHNLTSMFHKNGTADPISCTLLLLGGVCSVNSVALCRT